MIIDTCDNPREAALYNHAHRMIARCGVRFDAELLPLPSERMPDSIEIYDSDLLMRRLGQGDSFVGDPAEISSDEDAAQARQIRLWRRMAQDPRGSWRKLIMPDAGMIERLHGLNAICPQFAEVTAWIVRAAGLAMVTGTPLRLDPCVVVGPPGVGKTFYAGRLAEALDTSSEFIAMNLMTDRGSTFTGLSPVWRASGPGKIAKLLLDDDHASPLIVIDEFEKASPINPNETPMQVLHSLLERENAVRFVDEFVDIPIRADHVIWFATANSLGPLPDSIVDRLIVFNVTLNPAEMLAIQRSIFVEANRRVGGTFAQPGEALFQLTARHSPRLLSRLWDIAMAFACEDGRRYIDVTDVRAAELVLLSGKVGARRPIGFVQSRRKGQEG